MDHSNTHPICPSSAGKRSRPTSPPVPTKSRRLQGYAPHFSVPPMGSTMIGSSLPSGPGYRAHPMGCGQPGLEGSVAEEITKRVTGKVQPGSIILFHNAALHTPEALPGINEYLIRMGIPWCRYRSSSCPAPMAPTTPSTTRAGRCPVPPRQMGERLDTHPQDAI